MGCDVNPEDEDENDSDFGTEDMVDDQWGDEDLPDYPLVDDDDENNDDGNFDELAEWLQHAGLPGAAVHLQILAEKVAESSKRRST